MSRTESPLHEEEPFLIKYVLVNFCGHLLGTEPFVDYMYRGALFTATVA